MKLTVDFGISSLAQMDRKLSGFCKMFTVLGTHPISNPIRNCQGD